MSQDLMSMTPLAEYTDMLYTRLAIEMRKHSEVTKWWVELHPPDEREDGVGYVQLRALVGTGDPVKWEANMHAIQHGARCSASVLETVIEHHISKFIEVIKSYG